MKVSLKRKEIDALIKLLNIQCYHLSDFSGKTQSPEHKFMGDLSAKLRKAKAKDATASLVKKGVKP